MLSHCLMDSSAIKNFTTSNGFASVIASASKQSGVSPCRIKTSELKEQVIPDSKWYLMRVSYGRERSVVEYLKKQGLKVFYPTQKRVVEYKGKKDYKIVSLIPNLLFVYSSENVLKKYVGKEPFPYLHHYYEKVVVRNLEKRRNAITIPDNQMVEFMRWCDVEADDKQYCCTPFKFKVNDIVCVTDGPFKGFMGNVVRFKGQTRVGVNIDKIGFICTNYIPKAFLKKI